MRRYAVLLHPSARREIDKAKAWSATRDPARIRMIDAALARAGRLLARFPQLGARVHVHRQPEAEVRHHILADTGYVLFYEVDHERRRVVLLRFRHEKLPPVRVERRRTPRK
jgi:plasmid stabilization system protein ParE